jgi:Mu transposase, C-terminal
MKTTDSSVTVAEQGIQIDGFWYISPKLFPLTGKPVNVRVNPADKSQAFVFSKTGYVCTAESPTLAGKVHSEPGKKKAYLAVAEILHIHAPETVATLRACIDSVYQREELGASREDAELIVAQLIEEYILFIDTAVLKSKLNKIRQEAYE